ncbi:MAG: Gfo/Idh/MocA family oxidoreductase [Haloarculaceae archaeon]
MYAESDAVDLVAVADVDEEQLERFGDVWDIPEDRQYLGHESMLEAEDLDVVSVATPTFLHHDHVVDAVRVGDPDAVWCEKPIASSVTDAREMTDACAEADTALVVNHTSRFTDNMSTVRNHVRDGLIGDVRSITGLFRRELLRNATHVLDTMVFVTDSRGEHVSGYLNDTNDAADALGATEPVDDSGGGGHVVFADGTFATVDCTASREASTYAYHFVGTDGRIEINIVDGTWQYWDLLDGHHVERDLPGVEPDPQEYARGFANAVDHIDAVVAGDERNRSSGGDALRSLEIIVGLYVSDFTGGRVSLPLDRPLEDVAIRPW